MFNVKTDSAREKKTRAERAVKRVLKVHHAYHCGMVSE